MRLLACFALIACAACGSAPGKARETAPIPFRTPSEDLPFVIFDAWIRDSGPVPVLIDTGDALPFAIAVTPEVAVRTGMIETGAPPFVSDGAIGPEPVRVRPARPVSIAIGGHRLAWASAGVTPAVATASAAIGVPIGAVLGYEFLRGRIVAIDYGCRRLALAAAIPAMAPTARLSIAPRRPLTLVAATVNGRGPFRFALDTGARSIILGPATALAAGLAVEGATELRGAGGAETAAAAGSARIGVGRETPHSVPILVSPALARISREAGTRVDGILGTSASARGRMTIDYPGARLWLEPAGTGRCRS
jgi:hypothetical protein